MKLFFQLYFNSVDINFLMIFGKCIHILYHFFYYFIMGHSHRACSCKDTILKIKCKIKVIKLGIEFRVT